MASEFKKNEIVIVQIAGGLDGIGRVHRVVTYGEMKDAGLEKELRASEEQQKNPDQYWYYVHQPSSSIKYAWLIGESLRKYNLFNRFISGINNTTINSAQDFNKIIDMPTYKSMTDFN